MPVERWTDDRLDNLATTAASLLTAGGFTHTGSGINIALDMIQNRKSKYRTNGISYYRPWVFY